MKTLTLNRQIHTKPNFEELDKMLRELEELLNGDLDNETLEAIIDFQDTDGSFKLLDSYKIPSDARVDFCHMPTYICSAILMKAYLLDGRFESELRKGLRMSCARGLTGHGYDALKGQIEGLKIFMKGGLREFIDIHGDLCPEFTEMIGKISEAFRDMESEGHFNGPWGEDFEEDIKAINEYFSYRNVFVYGTLMRGEGNHGFLDKSDFISKATINGYDMYDVGWYPAIVKGNSMIIGELYQVPKEDMASIDMLEGEGDLYKKKVESVNDGLAFVYVYLGDVSDLERIASWKKHVWYVSYGSNMLFERFRCYIEGGSYKGSREKEPCDDMSLPVKVKTYDISHDMYFGNYSLSWDGCGVSFLDVSNDGEALGVAYLITEHQLDHVARWENNGRDLCDDCGWYEHIVKIGEMDGFEVKTVTNLYLRDYNEPSCDYLDTLREGIRKNWSDMSDEEIRDYLEACMR